MGWRLELVLALSFLSMPAVAAESTYRELVTSQFTLVSAVGERETRQIARRIGLFRAAIEQAFGVTLATTIPMRIHALSAQDWARYAQPRDGVAGYFIAQPFSCDLLFDAEDPAGGAYELMLHEYTHYILRTFFVNDLPAFFDEGLAEVFSSAQFDGERVRLVPRDDHVRFLARHDWLAFERMLKVRREDAEYVDHDLAPAFYAQSWASLYYVIARDPAVGSRVVGYMQKLNAGETPLTAATQLFDDPQGDANRSIAKFLASRALRAIEIRVPERLHPERSAIRLLGADESRLALGELLLRIGNRQLQALQLFEDVGRRRPNESRAHIGAAWARLQDGHAAEAGARFDATELPDAASPATAVSLGRGLFQVAAAMQISAPSDEQQRARFRRARELFSSAMKDHSTRLEATNGYILASLALDERDAALIPLARSAFESAPRSSELAVGLALLHELDGRKDEARRYWREAARNSRAGPMRTRIQSLLDRGGETRLQHGKVD